MKRSDTKIHQIELLLTLDYLLNYTDIDHPATQQDICRHARNFGLKYDPKASKGNDVRRQRIGDCLQFLQYIFYKYKDTDKIPFVINSTDSGKFYIEEKNHLNEEQIIKILSAVQNDKYTKDEDSELLINKLLDSLTNKYNREFYKNELDKENKRVLKYKADVKRKINLVNKAYRENKLITIYHKFSIYSLKKPNTLTISPDLTDEKFRNYRVYKIKEYKNKPYAILIPIAEGEIICRPIENLNIPAALPTKEILTDDEKNRDLELLFKQNCRAGKSHNSIDEYIDKQIMPGYGHAYKTSFFFLYIHYGGIKSSFEEFFSRDMPVILTDKLNVDKEAGKKISSKSSNGKAKYNDKYGIIAEPVSKGKEPIFGVVNITINELAFTSWLYENPQVASRVYVVSPQSINKSLALFNLQLVSKYKDYITDEMMENIFEKANERDFLLDWRNH